MNRIDCWWLIGLLLFSTSEIDASGQTTDQSGIFARDSLVAWCIVPFDGKKRGPAERAQMISNLGLKRIAYDWRSEHVPTFEQEILEYKKRGLEYFAFWGVHDDAFKLFEKHQLRPQIWEIIAQPAAADQPAKVKEAAEQMLPLVERTRRLGSKLGLYNHGGWSGLPENMVAVCRYLRGHHDADHVGIVYNLHHAHPVIDRFAESLQLMKPYLLCLNLNGMSKSGEANGQKILPLGAGDLDVSLLKVIRDSGYDGPIGIIGHTQDDVQQRLQDNLDGLEWLLPQIDGKTSGKEPEFRTWKSTRTESNQESDYSTELVEKLVAGARDSGNQHRGLVVFGSAQSACLSCHKLGDHGGAIGPDLLKLSSTRKPKEIVESVVWPARHVEQEYQAVKLLTDAGNSYRGFVISRDEQHVVLRDPSKTKLGDQIIPTSSIEREQPGGTLMPDNLLATMSEQQASDLFEFLFHLGGEDGIPIEEMNLVLMHANIHAHGAAKFAHDRKPLDPTAWPSWNAPVNRGRDYDFYSKQADHFRSLDHVPPLLAEYPGLDGGNQGHWGNQDEETWASNSWNEIELGSVQCGIFRGGNVTVARGVCLQLGKPGELSVCFNPDTLTYDAAWKGKFLKFSSVRHGFMDGVMMAGKMVDIDGGTKPSEPFEYHGFYRIGKRAVFAYRIGDRDFLDIPLVRNGKFIRQIVRDDQHPLAEQIRGADPQWPQMFQTKIEHGSGSPYAIDAVGSPGDNPWNSTFFLGGHDFLPDGSAVVCTMRGDVWKVSGLPFPSEQATWQRIASGLHQALGVVVDEDGIFVLGRDQITRLHDLNGDGETDFYECFSNAYETSTAGHDFICGLQRDNSGNFYLASGNQGAVRISPDGQKADVVATGFRNPDGLGVSPDGLLTVPCSEGNWTPATMICGVRLSDSSRPYFGYPGPKDGQVPALPMVYLPRGLDNSAGGQIAVTSDRWGPLEGQMIHFSFGTGAHFLLLRDEVAGQLQGAIVPLPGEFRSGAHRGRFNPADGQLYVSGMQGWGSYTTDGGCFQRVRYTGDRVQLPIAIAAHENGVALTFSSPLDPAVAGENASHFAQCWNFRYSGSYGSPEFSTKHFGLRGHDPVAITGAHLNRDGKQLFLEMPDLQPVNQLHLRVQTRAGEFRDVFATIHELDQPYTAFKGYRPMSKQIARHPILDDMARETLLIPNPHRVEIDGARAIEIETGSNLTYKTSQLRVKAGEAIALTLNNPDVVPHNWALIASGTLEKVGGMANRLISDPDAAVRHYIPDAPEIIAYTDVVLPKQKFTIYFCAPNEPGRYPYLCTFPGHWPVMNGVMIVE